MSDLADLKRRVEEATEHVRFLRAAGGASSGYTADLIEELAACADAAEARVKVLEEALRQAADARMPGEARRIARAALASKEEGGR